MSGGEGSAPARNAPADALRWSRLSRPAILAVGLALGAAVTGGCWLIVFLSGGAASSAEKTFGTSGTLTLADSSLSFLEEGERCTGLDGYSDIQRGAQVNVTGADGTLVATGELEGGKKAALGCEFPFTIEGIPQGSKFYTVEVSHRGGLTQTEDELRSGGLAFTLGR
ncbi:hypothetical protein ABZZ20_24625 [Streptomyces sp. NPDC006430]|uniref:hypothetical protein n=1 Tax=Streptomyces sp. NPDC006430 TaxID=3154299 RepID=UPI0033B836C3